MVCEKCEKKGKLGKVIDEIISLLENPIHDSNGMVQVITPDPWKAGASNTTKPGGRKVGENKLLTASKNRFNPMTTEFKKCKICKVGYRKSKVSETSILYTLQMFFSAKSSPGGFSLLPGVRLQKRDLCNVRCEGAVHKGLQTERNLNTHSDLHVMLLKMYNSMDN